MCSLGSRVSGGEVGRRRRLNAVGAGLEQLGLLHDVPRVREDSHNVGDVVREVVRRVEAAV